MNQSALSFLSKQYSLLPEVPATQISIVSQPQSFAVDGNTTNTIASSASCPSAPASKVWHWADARVVASDTYYERYCEQVIQLISNSDTVTMEISAGSSDVIGAINTPTSATTSGSALSSNSKESMASFPGRLYHLIRA